MGMTSRSGSNWRYSRKRDLQSMRSVGTSSQFKTERSETEPWGRRKWLSGTPSWDVSRGKSPLPEGDIDRKRPGFLQPQQEWFCSSIVCLQRSATNRCVPKRKPFQRQSAAPMPKKEKNAGKSGGASCEKTRNQITGCETQT